MDFDRFDICEAHWLFAHDFGDYARMDRLDRMHFHMAPGRQSFTGLTENGKAIYRRLAGREYANRRWRKVRQAR